MQEVFALCDFGLAGTECVRTFASYSRKSYAIIQIALSAMGFLAFAASVYKYYGAVRYLGSPMQQRTFLLMIYASVTFLIRAIDPYSYGHIIPRWVTFLLADTSTAAIYSVLISCAAFWISVIQQRCSSTEKSTSIVVLEVTFQVLTWGFFIIPSLFMIGSNGFGGVSISVKLGGASILLGVISTTCVIYGYRIHRRLQHIGNQMNANAARPNYARTSQLLAGDSNTYENLEEQQNRQQKPAQNSNASARILKILCLMEVFSLAAMGAQITVALKVSSVVDIELSCSNGQDCDKLHLGVPYLLTLQYVGIWVILWSFRKIHKRQGDK